MPNINPLIYNKLLSIYARSDLNNIENINKVINEAFQQTDNLYQIYEHISQKLGIKFRLTNSDIINILSLFYVGIREKEMRLKLFQTKPYWWLITNDEKRIKQYILTKLITMLDKTSTLSHTTTQTPTINTITRSIKEGSIPPASELSNKEIFEILKKLTTSKNGKINPAVLRKNLNPSNITGLIELLQELSTRTLTQPERQLLTEIFKTLIEYLKSIQTFNTNEKTELTEKLKYTIMQNYHNIEPDKELLDQLSELDSTLSYGLFYSKIDQIIEEDPNKLVHLLPDLATEEYNDLFENIKQKLLDLTTSKTTWMPTAHKKQIDYRNTIYKTIKNADIPKIAYQQRQETIGDIIFLIDASGSMRALTQYRYKLETHLDALQVSLITAWLFIKAVKEFGNGEYKILIFAEKIVDITDYELEKIISLTKTPEVLHQLLGGGTNLTPALKHIKEKYAGMDKNIIIITDTGDLAIHENKHTLQELKNNTKTLIIACPSEFFEETVKPFQELEIPLIKYDKIEELIEGIKQVILPQ